MSVSIFISELLFTIIIAIAVMVFWQLWIAQPQNRFELILKRVLLWYFGIEIYMHILFAWYWWKQDYSGGSFQLYVYTPKAIMKLVLLYLIIKHNRRQT